LDTIPSPERVSGNFEIQIAHWNDFFATLKIDPFAVTGYEDYKFRIDNIVVDFSDELSPTGLPPQGYETPFVNAAGFSNLWQGIYVELASLQLPNLFNKNSGEPITVGVKSVLFDENGFSGTAFVSTPILNLDEGNAGGWGFSIDKFQLTFLANKLSHGGFGGKINVPIFRSSQCNTGNLTAADCFDYNALILANKQFQFSVVVPPDINYCADLWKAGNVKVYSNSSIAITVSEGKFLAQANLHGQMVISANIGRFDLKMPDTIRFENLIVRNKAPYFSFGNWQMPTSLDCKLAGFGISLSNIGMGTESGTDRSYLNLGLGISLSKDSGQDSLGISAKGNFRIYGKLNTSNNIQKWVYDDVKLTSIGVDASFAGVQIKGELAFYEDTITGPTGWGKGFRGLIKIKINALGIGVDGLAQFGRKPVNPNDSYKYFFLDLMAHLPKGNQALAPLDLRGIGGGVFYRMSRDTNPVGLGVVPPINMPPNLGVSLSGVKYVPDINAGVGLKATIAVALAKETAFNGSLTFEALFNASSQGGGLRSIAIDGMAQFMEKLDLELPPRFSQNLSAKMKAKASIAAQFTPSFKLHGSLETYLNLANVIQGVGPQGRVVLAEFHTEPGLWYINVGTPTQRAGLQLQVGGVNLAKLDAYIDIGKQIPPMAPLPPEIASATGLGNFAQQESSRATGHGFAFGASLRIGDGQRRCAPSCNAPFHFYADFLAIAGFDLMLQDFGDTECSNTGEQIGINGWYATGQAYSLLQANVGLQLRVFGQTKNFVVLGINSAMAIQMKLPNPYWVKGRIKGNYNLLGGLVKGKTDFPFQFGQSCEFTSNNAPVQSLAVISYLNPVQDEAEVDVAAHPNATFNLPVGTSFSVEDINGQSATFKTELAYARIKYKNYTIPATLKWEDDLTNVELLPQYMLPTNDSVTFEVKVNIYKNGVMQDPEIRQVRFKTGKSYEEIPDFNVKAAYPQDGQYNFYPKEWIERKGYVMLHANQQQLFLVGGDSTALVARFTPSTGPVVETLVTYNYAQTRIDFPIPADELQLATMYKLEIIRAAREITSLPNGSASRSGGSTYSYEPPTDKVLYDAYFRTSAYNTFTEKINALGISSITGTNTPNMDGAFKIDLGTAEPFDEWEMGENNKGFAVMEMRASLDQTTWFNSSMKPLIYNDYATAAPNTYGMQINDRQTDVYGPIPYKGVFVEQASGGTVLKITKEDFEAGVTPATTGPQYINYLVPNIAENDFADVCQDLMVYIWNRCSNDPNCGCCLSESCCYYIGTSYPGATCNSNCSPYSNVQAYREDYVNDNLPTDKLRNLYKKQGWVVPPAGGYPITLTYKLPGLGTQTAIKTVTLQKSN
jgi:hypothetical protein